MTQTKFRYATPLHDLDRDEWSDELRPSPVRPASPPGSSGRREQRAARLRGRALPPYARPRWALPALPFLPVAAEPPPSPAADPPDASEPASADQEWQGETALSGFVGSLDWRALRHPWPREPGVTKDGVYIIAKQRSGDDWEIVKVGKSANLRDRLNGGRVTSGVHAGSSYKELARAGYAIFWAATRERAARADGTRGDLPVAHVERLIARILERVPGMTGHAEHEPPIREVSGKLSLTNPLPPPLAHFGARSFHHDGAAAPRPHARYPRFPADQFVRHDKTHEDTIALKHGDGHAFEVLPFEFD